MHTNAGRPGGIALGQGRALRRAVLYRMESDLPHRSNGRLCRLADPHLLEENRAAPDALTQILKLGSVYIDFNGLLLRNSMETSH